MRTRPLTRHRWLPLAALLAAGSFLSAGCGAGDRADAAPATADSTRLDGAAADSDVAAVAPAPSPELPERIYFDLTRYDWYARGEPLVHSDVRYEAGGNLLAAPLSAMEKVGEYQGVDVYATASGGSDTALYVPVFPGYWQPFVRTGAATTTGG